MLNEHLMQRSTCANKTNLAEHGEDGGQSLNKSNSDLASNFRVPLSQVFQKEVVKLSSIFDTGGTTADLEQTRLSALKAAGSERRWQAYNNHVKKTVNFRLRLTLEGSGFDAC